MTSDLTDLIPEFNLIYDDDLRRRVLAVWSEAMQFGGWAIEDLSRMPYTLLVEDVDISFPQHVSVVCRLCLAIEGVLTEEYGDRYEIDTTRWLPALC